MSGSATPDGLPPVHPDGTPDLGAPGVVGTASIYDWIYPQGLDPSKKTIWYDIQPHRPKITDNLGAPFKNGVRGVRLANGQIGTIVAGPSADGSPLVQLPNGRQVPLSQVHKVGGLNMTSPEQIMTTIAQMSQTDPKAFMAIQTYLSSGVWGTVHVSGSFDHDTEVALGKAMLQWSKITRNTQIPVDFQDYLTNAGTSALNLQNGGGTQPAPIPVTDPTTIKAAAQQAAQTALGHTLQEGELNQFVSQFQHAQESYQTAKSGVISSPDLGTEADKFVQGGHPGQVHANNEQAYFSELVNMLTSGAQRPNQEPVAPAG